MAAHRIEHLTDQQEEIIRFIRRQILDRGEAPTLSEIGETFGLRSRATVHYHLRRMEALGVIVRESGRHRGIRLT
ncbi:LexA family protein [Streptomyces tauricus]|uniref:LexA family protein n=1 Tax=Streptomyces tauricus TaxID=68274 RepID=UPI00387F3316